MLLCFVSGFICVSCFVLFGRKTFAVFQQCGYLPKEFLKAYFGDCRRDFVGLSTYSLVLLVLLLAAIPLVFVSEAVYFAVFFFFGLIFSCVVFCRTKAVKKAVLTKRYTRIIAASATVSLLGGFLISCAFVSHLEIDAAFCLLYSLPPFLSAFLSPLILTVGFYIMLPLDKSLYIISVKKCERKLEKYPDLIKIGITGSYGKTSVKNFLEKMLSQKYEVLATPKSYNTPLGICEAVKKLDESHEIFIAEMGARRRGDIKTLCEIVKPDIGIITGICAQHLETFGSLENVKRAKNELIEGLSVSGLAVFSSDSEGTRDLYEKCDIPKMLVGINGKEVRAANVREDENGLKFDMIAEGKIYSVESGLHGKHNASNLCIAAAVALKSGVPIEKILLAIRVMKNQPHRLTITKNAVGITIIDDGYNANEKSVESAVETLSHFGGRRFVVTPGLVETGDKTAEMNERVGAVVSKYADEIIAVGKNAKYVLSGVKGRAKGVLVNNLKEAEEELKRSLKSGDAVLFLNDVPDKYGV